LATPLCEIGELRDGSYPDLGYSRVDMHHNVRHSGRPYRRAPSSRTAWYALFRLGWGKFWVRDKK
jgi:hypothetical protein